MAGQLRNVRCKSPRPIEPQFHAPARYLQHAYRWGPSATPTPPPVAVHIDPTPPSSMPQAPAEPSHAAPSVRSAVPAFIVMLFGLATLAWGGIRLLDTEAKSALRVRTSLAASIPDDWAVPAPPKPPRVIQLQHEGYLPLRGGVLIAPDSFKPDSPDYDLVVHFHGNVSIVRKSMEYAGINAALAVINLGERSKVYRTAYETPGTFAALLAQIHQAVERRGLAQPKLRRIALTAWSGGYTAIESTLRTQAARSPMPLDAILVFDGLHCGFTRNAKRELRSDNIRGFIDAAHAAARGDLLLSLTHTQIDPITYGSTKRTAEYLLHAVGANVTRQVMLPLPQHVTLPKLQGVARTLRERRMIPVSDTQIGGLRVQGFHGNEREDHAAHLLQMAATALPLLAARWRNDH
jgi:hypothetical protein